MIITDNAAYTHNYSAIFDPNERRTIRKRVGTHCDSKLFSLRVIVASSIPSRVIALVRIERRDFFSPPVPVSAMHRLCLLQDYMDICRSLE